MRKMKKERGGSVVADYDEDDSCPIDELHCDSC